MQSAFQWLFSCADARPGKGRSGLDPFETWGLELHEEQDLQAAYIAMAGMRQGMPDPHVVIFLDVDGVLHAKGCELDHFSAANMRPLRHIVLTCNATVVLSSSWRRKAQLLQRCDAALKTWGLAGVTDITPDLKSQGLRREDEILIWLKRHPEVQHWLALDDLELTYGEAISHAVNHASHASLLMAEHFVKTDPEIGLRDMAQVSRALKVLQRPRGNVEESLKRKRATQRSPICA